ncbi:hypothetical protein NQ314_009452 [Rhamnusium bicolor]|uniref:DDE Tnp4 domain-containing protein n=1 Tax=Rhamnusium bicolor TaxID=1586634 RepID=A0AAV8Y0K6_9CUCU|nr:hypothetical protein NQ314_009452 [Rhamnusium bicolor]
MKLSRARRVVENALGILVARWRVFRKSLEVQPELVDKLVLASCSLHNLLRSDAAEPVMESERLPVQAFDNLDGIRRHPTKYASKSSRKV